MLHRRPDPNDTENSPNTGDAPPKPCWFMKGLLSSLSEDSLTGVARWYAENHTKGCPHCSATLISLRIVRSRLRTLGMPEIAQPEDSTKAGGALTAERRAALETALSEIDREAGREPIGMEAA